MILHVLLVLYGFLTLSSAVFMAALHFLHDRKGYYKTAGGVWIGLFLALAADGWVAENFENLNHIFGIPLVVISMFSFAKLTHDIYKIKIPFIRLAQSFAALWIVGASLHFIFHVPVVVSSFLICLGVAMPGLVSAYKLFRPNKSIKKLNVIDRLFGIVILCESLHILDYPILRPNESLAIYGFSLGLFLIYLGAMLIPVVINQHLNADLYTDLEKQVLDRTNQLVRAEEKLVNSAKMSALGEMASGIAHEINTPLSTINVVAEQAAELLDDIPLPKNEVAERMKLISETVTRIGQIIDGMRTFSRDGNHDQFTSVPLKKIISDTLILCTEKVRNSGVRIEISAFPEHFRVQCRSVQISQVLLNLISNAKDAITPLKDRWIRIEATEDSSDIKIRVTDSGSGIPDAIVKKIFQPFFTTKDVGQGTGLGLSVSKGIVDSHGGTIAIDNTCKNTCFVVTLPKGQPYENSRTSNSAAA